MVHADQGGLLRVIVLAVADICNGCKGMGDESNLKAVLAETFLPGISHESPSVYIFHS